MAESSAYDELFEVPVKEEEESVEEVSADVQALLQIGYLTDTFEFAGRQYLIRTLKIGEELQVGLISQKWVGTIDEGRAYVTAVLAAAIQTVNGKPLIVSLGPSDEKILIDRKFEYLLEEYYWNSIKELYNSYYKPLLDRQIEAFEEIKKNY